ncbi:unnamed protein product [Discula destructiva]
MDPGSTSFIRACTLGDQSMHLAATDPIPIENPKKASELFLPSLESSLACKTNGTAKEDELRVASISGNGVVDQEIGVLLDGMRRFFDDADNCDEKIVFGYHNGTAASLYVGSSLGKQTVNSALEPLARRLATDAIGNRAVAELCGGGRGLERVFGAAIHTSGDLAGVQRTAWQWSEGTCAVTGDLENASTPLVTQAFEIMQTNNDTTNSISTHNETSALLSSRFASGSKGMDSWSDSSLGKRVVCRYVQVVSGDSCGSLASRCGISPADFTKFNPQADLW